MLSNAYDNSDNARWARTDVCDVTKTHLGQLYFSCVTTAKLLSFVPETDHPEVMTRNRSQSPTAAGKDCERRLCKCSNQNITVTHNLQRVACWKQQCPTVLNKHHRILLFACIFADALMCYHHPEFSFFN